MLLCSYIPNGKDASFRIVRSYDFIGTSIAYWEHWWLMLEMGRFKNRSVPINSYIESNICKRHVVVVVCPSRSNKHRKKEIRKTLFYRLKLLRLSKGPWHSYLCLLGKLYYELWYHLCAKSNNQLWYHICAKFWYLQCACDAYYIV